MDYNVVDAVRRTKYFLQESLKLEQNNYPYLPAVTAIYDYLQALDWYYEGEGFYRDITIQTGFASYDYWLDLKRAMLTSDIIVIPTEDELPFRYFVDTHAVRAYPLGISLSPTIEADGRLMSPLEFFIHDALHLKWIDRAFCEAPGETDAEKTARYRKNVALILQDIDQLKNRNVTEACELILFDSFHELPPQLCDFKPLKEHMLNQQQDIGVVIEIGTLVERIKRGLESGFYGKPKQFLAPFMNDAENVLLELIDRQQIE